MVMLADSSKLEVQLMGRFRIRAGPRSVALPSNATRVVAFLALHPAPSHRSHIAGQLWPDISENRARAKLRDAVWKVNSAAVGLIEGDARTLRLAPEVEVDVARLRAAAKELLHGPRPGVVDVPPDLFAEEMLLGWDDEWALFERERLKQLCVHALESLSNLYLEAGSPAAAIDSAFLAVKLEPLRESAHRAISRAHLVEGNVAEARRQFDLYTRLLQSELGIVPSREYHALLGVP